MPLLAEEIVQEWLNRKGYFTIRGIRCGSSEIDLLAIKPYSTDGHTVVDCRHVEVQVSLNPMNYFTQSSAKRMTSDELRASAEKWVHKKFFDAKKVALRNRLALGEWSYELVTHRVKYPEELEYVRQAGIHIHQLTDVLKDLAAPASPENILTMASGSDFVSLLLLSHNLGL